MTLGTKPLTTIAAPTPLTPDVAASGVPVPAIERLRHMSAQAWEDFIFEWAHSLQATYARTEQCGGAGDMGRDIVASVSMTDDDPWDNYQCKHYDHALAPSDIWIELGKLAYYSYINEYTIPGRYVFVAPRGAGNTLSKLLRRPDELRAGLYLNWDKSCQHKITSKHVVAMDGALQSHIDSINFSIFTAASPLTIIDEHSRTRWHAARFGGGLPMRQTPVPPPTSIAPAEATYVRALLDAYEDRHGAIFQNPGDVTDSMSKAHLVRSRREFYSAESLREFSRDNVPPGTFEKFLDEVHDGVVDVVDATHTDAFERVLEVVKHAKALQLTANALVTRTTSADRGGMCHQLANSLKLRWRR